MKSLKLLLLLIISTELPGSQIPVGIYTDKIHVWRYWEKTNEGYKPKMIVFNTTDSTIELALWERVFRGMHLIEDTSKTKLLVSPTEISANSYLIFNLPTMTDKNAMTAFYINGKRIGILDCLSLPPEDIPEGKYLSDEGLNGRYDDIWISKKNLITDEKQLDTINLYFNYFDSPRHINEGHYTIDLFPSVHFERFEIYSSNHIIGEFNLQNKYSFEVLTSNEIEEQDRIHVQIVYKATKSNHFSIGLSCTIKLYQNERDQTGKKQTNAVSQMSYELPIIIQ